MSSPFILFFIRSSPFFSWVNICCYFVQNTTVQLLNLISQLHLVTKMLLEMWSSLKSLRSSNFSPKLLTLGNWAERVYRHSQLWINNMYVQAQGTPMLKGTQNRTIAYDKNSRRAKRITRTESDVTYNGPVTGFLETNQDGFGLLISTIRSANMERADITSPERAGDFISNSQARRDPPSQSHPHHICDPQGHGPRHCHRLWISLFSSFLELKKTHLRYRPLFLENIERNPSPHRE